MKWVLHYLSRTGDYAITCSKSSSSMQSYVDANFASDFDKRRSITGYIFQNRYGPISWMSKLQVTVALSIVEVEYMALTEQAKMRYGFKA